MKLLLNTHCNNEFFEGCSYAFIDLTPELAQLILQRLGTFELLYAADSMLTEIQYYGCDEVFLNGLPEDIQDYADDLAGNDFIELPAVMAVEDFENVAERTECDRMVITNTDVYWTAYPKHCDPVVETRPIGYDTVRKAAAGMEVTA